MGAPQSTTCRSAQRCRQAPWSRHGRPWGPCASSRPTAVVASAGSSSTARLTSPHAASVSGVYRRASIAISLARSAPAPGRCAGWRPSAGAGRGLPRPSRCARSAGNDVIGGQRQLQATAETGAADAAHDRQRERLDPAQDRGAVRTRGGRRYCASRAGPGSHPRRSAAARCGAPPHAGRPPRPGPARRAAGRTAPGRAGCTAHAPSSGPRGDQWSRTEWRCRPSRCPVVAGSMTAA